MKKPNSRLLVFAILAAVTAHADEGNIRICREPGIIGALDRKNVNLPAGSHFVNLSARREVQYIIFTTKPTTIGPKPACVIAKAKTETNFSSKPITARSGRFLAQFSIAGLDVFAVAIEDFR